MRPQVREALKLANEHRLARSATRAEIMALSRDEALAQAAEYVEDTPRHLRTLEASHLLMWCHGVKRARMLRYLLRAGVSELALLGWLTERQRRALAKTLREDWFR